MQCQYKQEYSRGGHRKCRCAITKDMCGFVYFCSPDNCYKNTLSFEKCLIRQKEMSKQEKPNENVE